MTQLMLDELTVKLAKSKKERFIRRYHDKASAVRGGKKFSTVERRHICSHLFLLKISLENIIHHQAGLFI